MRHWTRLVLALALIFPLLTSIGHLAAQEAKPLPREWYVGKILFKSDRGGKEAFYAMNSDGSEVQLVQDPNVG
ncbi:MAG: hypothetical protein ACUVWR_05145, partial [Anaerolineae bacterium]